MGMLYRIVIEAEGQDPQGLKEDLASALERYGPARVVAVEPKERWRQEDMLRKQNMPGMNISSASSCGSKGRRREGTPPYGATESPWERADRAWEQVMKGLEHG